MLCVNSGVKSANISPSKAGTTKKPKSVKLQIKLTTTTTDGSVPPSANHVILFLPRGLIFQGSKFKSCSAATINDPNKGPWIEVTYTGNTAPQLYEQFPADNAVVNTTTPEFTAL